jgi:hypothetical protein
MRLEVADGAPEVAFRAPLVTEQDDQPDLEVAAGILVAGEEGEQQEGHEREKQSQGLTQKRVMTEYRQVLPDRATKACANQQE